MLRFDSVPRDGDDDGDDDGWVMNRAHASFWIAPSQVPLNGTVRIGLGAETCRRSTYAWLHESSDGSSCTFCLQRQYVYSFNGLIILRLGLALHRVQMLVRASANTSLMFRDYISISSCEELSENMAPPLEGVGLLR